MEKVISSSIIRSFNKSNDELYELLSVVPAQPIAYIPEKSNTCDFQPRNDKQYIPKKKNRQKVKTVRDIRNYYEKVISYELPTELEQQQNDLLRKIKVGSLKEERTKSFARNVLSGDKPLTKSSWQMLMNINPYGHTHSTQYVLWNGRLIRINGSKGGNNKFICKYDLEKTKKYVKNRSLYKNKTLNTKKGLLQNSLSIDFKPGPLARKKFLDNSYQKYHVGHIDVVNLPKSGLEIQPLYGCPLEPTIASFVNKLRDEDGSISQKWAEFAVSVLGAVNGSNVSQLNQNRPVTFDLTYKHDQMKLLMRRDFESNCDVNKIDDGHKFLDSQIKIEQDMLLTEVQVVMNKILDAVEISVTQDDMCKEDDEIRGDFQNDQPQNNNKEKFKRRYCELDRLAVTVIRLNENESDVGNLNTCQNSHCTLGCICNSLQSSVVLRGHCGRIDCMFECKCDFSKYAVVDALNNDCPELLPSLYNLNNEINCTLSKEEQKFHQTVIVSGDKSILLKSKKRNCKSSKKYEEYYTNICLKSKSKQKPVLKIVAPKLNCQNIEPWCMVHNLYKCFCKGRFTDTTLTDMFIKDLNKKSTELIHDNVDNVTKKQNEEKNIEKEEYSSKNYQVRTRKETSKIVYSHKIYEIDSDEETNFCARSKKYEGRKYSNGYYLSANNKIKEMEVNDSKLRQRLHILINNSSDTNDNNVVCTDEVIYNVEKDNADENVIAVEKSNTVHKENVMEKIDTLNSPLPESDSKCANKPKITMVDESSVDKSISNKPKLVAWLESSYQEYKRRLDLGICKNTLEPPKKGKVALYQWDFILNRYSERKNLFLVSKQPPYRIFMAVNANNPLFENCINIDDIRFADLNKYPTTVKNLLTNTNDMRDYFCILFGYNHCWEFIGTVTKVSDPKDNNLENEISKSKQECNKLSDMQSPNLLVNLDAEASITISSAIQQMSPISENSPKKSKWFIMTIENDFSEIQFYNRGFFVKYKSIIKAINVARMSGKTVRLSSQKCAEKISDGTQFGIYAIPNSNEYCVFIGPYELGEPLGIETIKTVSDVGKRKRTRGIWITTDKVDDLKVIDNPLSFIPSQRQEYNDLITIENSGSELTNLKDDTTNTEKVSQETNPVTETAKVIKPIKISKSNGFYHLSSNTILKSVLKSPNQQLGGPINPKPLILSPTNTADLTTIPNTDSACAIATPLILSESESRPITSSLLHKMGSTSVTAKRVQNRPVAEVAPQIKIAAVYSECDSEKTQPRKRREGGMFILKPEEINQRLVIDGNKSPKAGNNSPLVGNVSPILGNDSPVPGSSKSDNGKEQQISMDIEDFLDTSTICTAPTLTETFVISDDDEASPNPDEEVKVVFIECTNIENLGVLRGEMHKTKGVRFDFPGFNVSDYYSHDEVFNKINQVLSRRVYVPDDIKLNWRIVNSMSEVKTQRLLKKESFGSNLIMTPQGIQKKSALKMSTFKNVKTYKAKKTIERKQLQASGDQIHDLKQDLEKESQPLEKKKEDLKESFTVTIDNLKSNVETSENEREELTGVKTQSK